MRFAQAVGRRHWLRRGGRRGKWGVAAMVYARLAPPIVIVHRPVRLHVAPVFAVTMTGLNCDRRRSARTGSPGPVAMSFTPVSSAGAGELVRRIGRHESVRVRQVIIRHETELVRRITAREERVVMGSARLPAVSLAGSPTDDPPAWRALAPAPAMARVERVLRRPVVAAAPPSDERVPDGWGSPLPKLRPATARQEIAGPELDRLADHVMRSLDRRVAAYRERHGRR